VRVDGPQRVVKQGSDAVVIIAAEEFDRVIERAGQPASLVAARPTYVRPAFPCSIRGADECSATQAIVETVGSTRR